MSRRALWTLAPAVLTVASAGLLGACGDDGTEPDTVAVTVQGTVTEEDSGDPVPGLYVHLIYGATVAPVAVDVAETDANGGYLVSGRVPAENCSQVQLWVLAQEEFDAFASKITAEPLGSCDTHVTDFTVTGSGGEG